MNWARLLLPREQYANIEEPKTAQTILRHPKLPAAQPLAPQSYPLIPEHLAKSVSGPEKAGVGGSIPSLATIEIQELNRPGSA